MISLGGQYNHASQSQYYSNILFPQLKTKIIPKIFLKRGRAIKTFPFKNYTIYIFIHCKYIQISNFDDGTSIYTYLYKRISCLINMYIMEKRHKPTIFLFSISTSIYYNIEKNISCKIVIPA